MASSPNVPFPSVSRPQSASGPYSSYASAVSAQSSSVSLISSRQRTALDVCNTVYGDTPVPSWDVLERLYEPHALYENPLVTATSRSMISDLHLITRQLSRIDVPKPLAVLFALLRIRRGLTEDDTLFRAVRAWTEIGEASEVETFDGQRRCVVEHTLNVLFLPGIHSDRPSHSSWLPGPASESSLDLSTPPGPPEPSLRLPGSNLSLPSPLHLQLHVLTRLSFNETGRITHHRDFWDVRDVLALVPGASIAQYVASRVAAHSFSAAAHVGAWALGGLGLTRRAQGESSDRREPDAERGKPA